MPKTSSAAGKAPDQVVPIRPSAPPSPELRAIISLYLPLGLVARLDAEVAKRREPRKPTQRDRNMRDDYAKRFGEEAADAWLIAELTPTKVSRSTVAADLLSKALSAGNRES